MTTVRLRDAFVFYTWKKPKCHKMNSKERKNCTNKTGPLKFSCKKSFCCKWDTKCSFHRNVHVQRQQPLNYLGDCQTSMMELCWKIVNYI